MTINHWSYSVLNCTIQNVGFPRQEILKEVIQYGTFINMQGRLSFRSSFELRHAKRLTVFEPFEVRLLNKPGITDETSPMCKPMPLGLLLYQVVPDGTYLPVTFVVF